MGKRLSYEAVKKEVEDEGWTLVSDTYVNLATQMDFKCPNGHDNYFTMSHWRHHKECPTCKANKYFKMTDHAPKSAGFRVLAFDQATGVSGWSVYDDEKLVKFGAWDSKGESSVDKVAKTKCWIASMIQSWRPDLVVFEDIQFQPYTGKDAGADVQSNLLVYKKLAHLQGVLMNYCYENGFTYKIVPVATWRAHSGVKGKYRTDRKQSAQLIVKSLYDINVSTDEADAILIGRFAAHDNKATEMVTFY